MKIILNNKFLDNLDLSNLFNSCPDYDAFYQLKTKKSGEIHYRLLFYLASLFNNIIISDIGTNKGLSAISLSHNINNKIFSFDLRERHNYIFEGQDHQKQKGCFIYYDNNVNFIVGNFYDFSDKILNSTLILLDIAHNGIEEQKFYKFLSDNYYKGIVVCDDINYNKEMIEFWNFIKIKKFDISKYGNPSGTGLIDFGGELDLILE